MHSLPDCIKAGFFPRAALSVAIAGTVLLSAPAFAEEQPTALDSQDKLMIRVVEWMTVEGEFRDWSKLTGEYTVSAAGTLSVPLIGEVEARGRSTAEVAGTISEAFQKKLGLSDKPGVSVELVAYRPFYVAGQVSSPGAYPYVPGLTVLKAVSLAGGEPRSADIARVEREMLNAKGEFDVLADEQVRLLIRHARIAAEAEGKTDFDLPPDVPGNPVVERIVADEEAILTSRQRGLALQLETLEDLKTLLRNEITSLEQKVKSQERQIDLTRKELAGLGSLADKGLVVNNRILNSERSVADMEGKLLDYQTEILRAKQDINKATQEANSLTNKAASDLAEERQMVEAALNQAKLKLETQKNLIAESQSMAANLAATGLPAFTVDYMLLRQADGKMQEVEADENTTVLPGDVVKVVRTIDTTPQAAVR